MQSTGHSCMHDLSMMSMHAAAMTYGTLGLLSVGQAAMGAVSDEWPGNSRSSGLIRTAALLTAAAASPKPTEMSRTLPRYSVMSPAAKTPGMFVAMVVSTGR